MTISNEEIMAGILEKIEFINRHHDVYESSVSIFRDFRYARVSRIMVRYQRKTEPTDPIIIRKREYELPETIRERTLHDLLIMWKEMEIPGLSLERKETKGYESPMASGGHHAIKGNDQFDKYLN